MWHMTYGMLYTLKIRIKLTVTSLRGILQVVVLQTRRVHSLAYCGLLSDICGDVCGDVSGLVRGSGWDRGGV